MKLKKIVFFVILFLITIVFVIYIVKYSKNNDQTTGNSADQTILPTRVSYNPSGTDMILKDLENQKIDYEMSLLYRVQYIFGDKSLPQQYLTTSTIFEDQAVFWEIKENYSKLSDNTKQALKPYLARPDDPDSYWNNVILDSPIVNSSEGYSVPSFSLVDTVFAYSRPTSSYKHFVTTTDGKIKVWYAEKKVGNSTVKLFESTAKQIAANFNSDTAYSRFNGLLGRIPPSDGTLGGDEKTDIYVVPGSNPLLKMENNNVAYGVNAPDTGRDSSFILIKDGLPDRHLKTTPVHELFHAFQRAFAWGSSENWWLEATAVWSEDYIYSKLDTEQEYLESFLPKPDIKLTKTGKNHEYGAYLFPFHLTQKFGDAIIKKIFQGGDNGWNAIKSIDKNIDGELKKNWKEFTLWNYNRKPARYYNDKSGKFSNLSTDEGANADMTFITGLGNFDIEPKELEALTSQVIDIDIDDDGGNVRKVIFKDFTNFTGKSEKAGLKAIIFPRGNEHPYVEDWTEKKQRSFCLDDSKEDVKRVILITSNANIESKISASKFKVEAKETCFEISQEEIMNANAIFALSSNYIGKVDYSLSGEQISKATKNAKYPYLGKWKVAVKYVEHWPSQTMMGMTASKMDFQYDHFLEFDLGVDTVAKDGNFTVQTEKGDFKTPGWQIVNHITGDITTIPANLTAWDLSSKQEKGVIYDMSEAGAKIKLPEFVLHNSGGYRSLEHPIILEIKKK
ncbi:MAG: hypothetical protein ABH832_01290 [bacterium]